MAIAPFTGLQIEQAFAGTGKYTPTIIRASAYPQLEAGVPTYAVIATLVTRADVDAALVEVLVSRTLEDIEALRSQFRLLATLDPERMQSVGLTAPLHEGARRAFAAFATAPTPGN